VRLVGHVAEEHLREDNIKTDLKEMAWERVDCSGQGCVGLL
jgi:hypothetical protein